MHSHADTLGVRSVDVADMPVKNQVRRVFLEFARFGTRSETKCMDVYRFMKLCRECELLTRPEDAASVDLIFYQVHT
jgi:p25-alpha